MPLNLRAEDCALVVVDMQPSFLAPIHRAAEVLDRAAFLLKVARLLEVPSLATEQYPERMGRTHERLQPLLASGAPGKMAFSCCGCSEFTESLKSAARQRIVLVGIETHICVSQTAHDLLADGYSVVVCADAVSSRTLDRHEIGLERMRAAGVVVAHTESVAYEWLQSASHPRFREALAIVKEHG